MHCYAIVFAVLYSVVQAEDKSDAKSGGQMRGHFQYYGELTSGFTTGEKMSFPPLANIK